MSTDREGSPFWGLMFVFASILFIAWSLLYRDVFTTFTTTYPFRMGFVKLFLLGTCGEVLKHRIKGKSWYVSRIFIRAIVWGGFGMWFTTAFPFAAAGSAALVDKGLWWKGFLPLTMSLWISPFGGFAWSMMAFHEVCNKVIDYHGWPWWRAFSLMRISRQINRVFIFVFIPATIWGYWILGHTATFALPPEWRVLSAGIQAIVLGLFLSLGDMSWMKDPGVQSE